MTGLSTIRNLQHLRALILLARYGSFRQASLETDVSIPTLRRHVEALEEDLAVDLLNRRQHEVVLTRAGRRLLEAARRIERELAEAETVLAVEKAACSGEVTLSAVDGTGTEWLIPHLQRFGLSLPAIDVKLTISPFGFPGRYEDFDLVIEADRPRDEDRVQRRLVTYTCGVYGTAALVERYGYPQRLEDLSAIPYISSDWVRARLGVDDQRFAAHELARREIMHTNSCSAQVNAVAAGHGWSIISHRWARHRPELLRLVPTADLLETELWLSARRGFQRIARIKALHDFLIRSFAEDTDLFTAVDDGERACQ